MGRTICLEDGYTTPARRDGVCAKHGGGPKRCSEPDCNKYARKGGKCMKHGGKVLQCSVANCDNVVQNNGVCTIHGAKRKKCQVPDCNSIARKDRLCYHHNQDEEWLQARRTTQNKYEKRRYNDDYHYRVLKLLRRRLHQTVDQLYKTSSVLKLTGCSLEELLEHLQNQFDDDMHWGNFGDWHIDHIKPCASFDLTDPKQQAECFHYTNLQPLWGEDNIRKGAKID